MALPPQPVVLDVLVLAVTKTSLKELQAPDEFRATVQELWPMLTAGDRLRLQVLWDHFAARSGFDAKVAACPICWLKTLEPRLGGAVDLPAPLAGLKTSEVATQAAKVFVRREDIDKLLGPADAAPPGGRPSQPIPASARVERTPRPSLAGTAVAEPGAPPASLEPGAAPVSLDPGAPAVNLDPVLAPQPGASPARTSQKLAPAKAVANQARQRLYGAIAGVVIAGAAAVIFLSVRPSAVTPTRVELRASTLPVQPGARVGNDVKFVLSDAGWTKQPDDVRKSQLREALTSLRGSGVVNVAVVDDSGKVVGTAQWTSGAPTVRLYR